MCGQRASGLRVRSGFSCATEAGSFFRCVRPVLRRNKPASDRATRQEKKEKENPSCRNSSHTHSLYRVLSFIAAAVDLSLSPTFTVYLEAAGNEINGKNLAGLRAVKNGTAAMCLE
ncbi:hypothetical protein L2E82_22771 [Cichorium intybus]|uniref:Uncharacterized protein n=1 Tax=Cichorium intybus TaxID=13427 RepID=A0ACB9DYP8_CICIN|nr:hypothetical protein L2E82_22771 [Cichorium intybus]